MAQPRFDAGLNQYVPAEADQSAVAASYVVDGPLGHTNGRHALTKPTAGAYTLSVPTLAEDGNRVLVIARTAAAHVVTVAGGLGGNAADDVITFAKVGDCIELIADNLKWVPTGAAYGALIS